MSSVTLNHGAINRLLQSTNGPVGRNVERRANLVLEAARAAIPASGLRSRSGALLSSLKVRMEDGPEGLAGVVYCDTRIAPHAIHLEQGTEAHMIYPRNKRVLHSPSGHPDPLWYPRRKVNHPGNKPYHFLSDSLRAAQY